jgi:hypothetical protein
MTVVLGSRYRDRHTGYEGVATARTEYENGCVQICLERLDDKGEVASTWFDEQRIVDPNGQPVEPTAIAGGGIRQRRPRR